MATSRYESLAEFRRDIGIPMTGEYRKVLGQYSPEDRVKKLDAACKDFAVICSDARVDLGKGGFTHLRLTWRTLESSCREWGHSLKHLPPRP